MSAKVAIVFGGSRVIGAAIALRLAKDGFDVASTYVSRPDRRAISFLRLTISAVALLPFRPTARIPPRSRWLSPTRSSISARLTPRWSTPASFDAASLRAQARFAIERLKSR